MCVVSLHKQQRALLRIILSLERVLGAQEQKVFNSYWGLIHALFFKKSSSLPSPSPLDA